MRVAYDSRDGKIGRELLSQVAKVSYGVARRWLLGIAKAKPVAEIRKKNLSDFRQQYDKSYIVPNRVKTALRELGPSWEYESQFVKLVGVTLADLGNVGEQFIEHVVVLGRDGRRAWAGTVATAEAMKKML